MTKVEERKRKIIEEAFEAYQTRIEDLYKELIFELAIHLNMEEHEVRKLLED